MKTNRSVERYVMLQPIRAQLDPVGLVRLRDISVQGACVEHSSEIPLGILVRIVIRLIPGTIPLTFEGVTLWSSPAATVHEQPPMYLCGIRFNQLTGALRSVLAQLCRHSVARVVDEPIAS